MPAEASLLAGEVAEACRLTGDARSLALSLSDYRTLMAVRDVRAQLEPWAATDTLRALDEQLRLSSDENPRSASGTGIFIRRLGAPPTAGHHLVCPQVGGDVAHISALNGIADSCREGLDKRRQAPIEGVGPAAAPVFLEELERRRVHGELNVGQHLLPLLLKTRSTSLILRSILAGMKRLQGLNEMEEAGPRRHIGLKQNESIELDKRILVCLVGSLCAKKGRQAHWQVDQGQQGPSFFVPPFFPILCLVRHLLDAGSEEDPAQAAQPWIFVLSGHVHRQPRKTLRAPCGDSGDSEERRDPLLYPIVNREAVWQVIETTGAKESSQR